MVEGMKCSPGDQRHGSVCESLTNRFPLQSPSAFFGVAYDPKEPSKPPSIVRKALGTAAYLGRSSREPHTGLGAGFKHGEQVGYSQKIPDRIVVVDKEKIALGLSSGDVEADDGAESRTVHPGDFLEVQNEPF